MADKLIIVESPAKAKTLKKFLGRKYAVEATMGHLIDLPKSKLGVEIEDNFAPRYITIRGKGKILANLKKKAKSSQEVYLATDPDREGEAISWHLSNALAIPNENCRVAFNEITKEAVLGALKNPRPVDLDLVNAQQARRILDRLVGYQISPILWQKVRKGLSAGRVQTVAVRIICEREEEIEAFVPEEYWSLEGIFKGKEGTFIAQLHRIDSKKARIANEAEAQKHYDLIKATNFLIEKIKQRKRKRNPAPPFTTSTLQQEAIRQLGYTARKTMFIAQQLYEGIDVGSSGSTGLITYMRTDSVRVAASALEAVRDYIQGEFGNKYLPDQARYFKKKGRSQDAHEAIRPTNPSLTPQELTKHLNKDQLSLYRLIWQRFVASQMAAAEYDGLTVDIAGDRYLFRTAGSRLTFPGFLKVLSHKPEDNILPRLTEKEAVSLEELKKEQHFTKAPPRYTEGTLVKTLEEKGIGRPSTYAPIVATIQQRGYVIMEEGRFKPTELGLIVNELLIEHFPEIAEIEFTALVESGLDRVEEGELDWVMLLGEFYESFARRLEEAKKNMKTVELKEEETNIECAKCGRKMVVKYGRFGKFLACPGYPDCKYTLSYSLINDIDCIKCDDGKIVERRTKKGRVFYGCTNFPACDFMIWQKPTKEKCPICGAFLVEKRSKAGVVKSCAREDCPFEPVKANR